MLSNDEKKLLIEANAKGHTSAELSDIFGITVNSVNRIICQYKRTVPYELRIHNRGRKSIDLF